MRFLIVDDHPIMRLGVKQLIQGHWPSAVLDEASTIAEALQLGQANKPDALVLDLSLPDASGTEGASRMLRALKGVHLAFTGILSVRRNEAVRAARRAGAIIHHGPSSKTTVVVRGRPNPLQAAGKDAGLKLMEIKRLREKGHRITLLNEIGRAHV